MGIAELRSFLVWCTAVNVVALMLWFVIFAAAGGWLHRIHGKWFSMSREAFDAAHYSGMMHYKLAIIFFNVAPLVAIAVVG